MTQNKPDNSNVVFLLPFCNHFVLLHDDMQKGENENEFFYFTGDFGLIKEKVTEITDRIIRRTVGTTLADFFAVSVCPVSFGLLPFQY